MATITISNTVYNDVKQYADKQNMGVDELIAMLINNVLYPKPKRKFDLLPLDQLEPELQDIINMPRIGRIDENDLNGEQARMEYYKEKYL